ncbi:MFS transporter [Nocardioides alcanivorans]|uniref:MFS transporter n=1 Tax=Nocardioides alcanivorans TaxID=2897352 RepID=UPI001F1A4844|nr:MFS transporter [Nocardioides alcanivorans]
MTTTRGRILVGAGSLVLVAMVASYAPTPLYPAYQARWGMSESDVSLAFAGYPVGVVVVLLGLGGLSDRIGRRATMLIGLAVMTFAMLILGFASGLPMLVGGRLLHGMAAGLITAAAAAALMQLHPRGADAGSFLNAFLVSLGVAVGPFVAGALAEHLPRPVLTPYLVVLALLLVPLISLAFSREAPSPPGAPGRLVRRLRVPRQIAARWGLAAAAIVVTNTLFGLVGAFGPLVAHELGWRSESAVGQLVALPLALVAVAQIGGRWLGHVPALLIGTPLAALGWFVLALGTSGSTASTVLVGFSLLGAGAGLNLFGAATLIGVISPKDRQAEIYAAWLVVAFGTLATSALLAGPLVSHFPLASVLTGCGVLAAALACWIVPGTRRLLSASREADQEIRSRQA